jgi:hypothetical protein
MLETCFEAGEYFLELQKPQAEALKWASSCCKFTFTKNLIWSQYNIDGRPTDTVTVLRSIVRTDRWGNFVVNVQKWI